MRGMCAQWNILLFISVDRVDELQKPHSRCEQSGPRWVSRKTVGVASSRVRQSHIFVLARKWSVDGHIYIRQVLY